MQSPLFWHGFLFSGQGCPSYTRILWAHPVLLTGVNEHSCCFPDIGRGWPFKRILWIAPLNPFDVPTKRCTSCHALKFYEKKINMIIIYTHKISTTLWCFIHKYFQFSNFELLTTETNKYILLIYIISCFYNFFFIKANRF